MATTTEQTFGLGAIGQIAQVVDDVEAATAFYRDRLGMRFLFAAPGLAFFDCGGVRLMLSRADSPEFDHPGSVLYFRVDDVHAAHAALRARDVAFIDAPHVVHRAADYDLWMTFFRDPDDNVLALMAEQRRGAEGAQA
jgi:catechol 2,3-dioxygenase-like lactoylglutathione lyase family enzyme